jgi:hypothetical protein
MVTVKTLGLPYETEAMISVPAEEIKGEPEKCERRRRRRRIGTEGDEYVDLITSAYANVLAFCSSLSKFSFDGISNIKLLSAFKRTEGKGLGVHPRSTVI